MKENFIKVLLSICICLVSFPFLAKGQLPYSPCSPSGGKRADVLGVETKYRAAGVTTPPTFTIPAGTKSIAVYVSSETGLTGTTDNDRADEDFITINAIIDVNGATSSGFVNYAKNTNANGTGTNVYGWKNVPIGDSIPQARKIGDADVPLNNVKFSISGSTLTIDESAKAVHSSYYVEYLSPVNNSLSPLVPQIMALLHGSGTTATDLSIPIPDSAEIIMISAKGTNFSAAEGNLTGGIEEGFMNMRFAIDITANRLNGFATVANGGSVDRRSTYVINNRTATSTNTMLLSGAIAGDYASKRITAGGVGLYDGQIYVSGSNLIIRRETNYARDFDDAYVVEFYSRVGLGMATEFIDSDISAIASGSSSTTGVTSTFKIPAGTNIIYFNQTGNAINSNNEANENALAAYGYIDLNAGTITGYYYQQVGLENSTRRDDNYAFKNVPLTGVSTRNHASKVGYTNPSYAYDISFELSADKSTLSVVNKTPLANPYYQFLLSADYYGSRPDIAFSSTGITFTKGPSCNIVTANVNVCNPGSGNSNGGMPVSFYSGDPTTDANATLVYTGSFNQDVPMGECRTFNFNIDLSTFPNVNIPLTMIINDNGSFVSGGVGHTVGTTFQLADLSNQNSTYKECYYDNNKTTATIAVNNCPAISLDPDSSSGATGGKDFLNYFAAGSTTGARITDNDAIASDPDGDNIVSATITLTNNLNGTAEYLQYNGTLASGLSITGQNSNTIVISGTASPATYIAALQGISYMNTNSAPNTTTRTITISLNDGKETGPASTASIVILTTPRVNVRGNGASIADNKTTTSATDYTYFGVAMPATGSVSRGFTVQNIGTGTINLTGTPIVTVTGDPGFTVTTQPTSSSLTNGFGQNFIVNFNPASHAYGNYTGTVTILNNDANTDRATYTFAVSALVNNRPTVSNDAVSAEEDHTITFTPADFLDNYTDPDGNALQYVRIISQTVNGNLLLNGAIITAGRVIPADSIGFITYVPTANWSGTTSFQWNGSDGLIYGAGNATMTINITAVNDVPTMTVPAGLAVTEHTPASLNGVSFADVDAGAFTVTATFSVPTGTFNTGTLTGVTVTGSGTNTVTLSGRISTINSYLSGNRLTYSSSHTPPATDTITVTINDNGNTGAGGEKTTTGYIPLTITAVNDAPVGTNANETTDEDTPFTSLVTATDIDGDTLTYSIGTGNGPSHGTIAFYSNGQYTYTPANNYHGPDQFTVTVSDGNGGTTTIVVNITVDAVNDAPAGTNTNETTDEDTPFTSLVTATDIDGDTLTYSIGTGNSPSHGTIAIYSNGHYTYTPAADYNGPDQFTVTVSDGNGGTTTIVVSITVNTVNDTPTGGPFNETVDQDTDLESSVTATDVDGDALTYSPGTTEPANGVVVIRNDGSYTYTPTTGFTGNDSFTINVSDGTVSVPLTVNITVRHVNQPPSGGTQLVYTDEDTGLAASVASADPDGDALTYTLSSNVTNGTLSLNNDGTFTYLPNRDYNGDDHFTVNISDGNGGTASIVVTIRVNPVNDDPVVTGGNEVETTTGRPGTGTIIANDPDGDPITFAPGDNPAHGTIDVTPDGTYTYTPDEGYTGDDSFTIIISDGKGGFTTVTVGVTVNPDLSNIPRAVDDSVTVYANTPVDINVLANDSAHAATFNPQTVEIVDQPAHGTVVVNSDGTITYTPAPGYTGEDSFTYRVQTMDDQTTNVATVKITTAFANVTVPTLFTPNGDGKNDVFMIPGLSEYAETELIIINRWGNEVYRTKNYQNTWKGEGLNEGTYFYLLRVKRTAGSAWEVIKGYTTLVRNFNN